MVFPLAKFRAIYASFNEVEDERILALSELSFEHVRKSCRNAELQWIAITAHLLHLRLADEKGEPIQGKVASATIDKVSVSFNASQATAKTEWYKLSPYGEEFLALLRHCSGSFMYFGGRPERAAFRSVGGRFSNGGRSW